jgi:hypothetical protein
MCVVYTLVCLVGSSCHALTSATCRSCRYYHLLTEGDSRVAAYPIINYASNKNTAVSEYQ